jgi:hypothetical protein
VYIGLEFVTSNHYARRCICMFTTLSPQQGTSTCRPPICVRSRRLTASASQPLMPRYIVSQECLAGFDGGSIFIAPPVATTASSAFPQPVNMGSTWDAALVREIASAISDEARAAFNHAGEFCLLLFLSRGSFNSIIHTHVRMHTPTPTPTPTPTHTHTLTLKKPIVTALPHSDH